MDANLLHISFEGTSLEDPFDRPEMICGLSVAQNAPNEATNWDRLRKAIPFSINRRIYVPIDYLETTDKIGGAKRHWPCRPKFSGFKRKKKNPPFFLGFCF